MVPQMLTGSAKCPAESYEPFRRSRKSDENLYSVRVYNKPRWENDFLGKTSWVHISEWVSCFSLERSWLHLIKCTKDCAVNFEPFQNDHWRTKPGLEMDKQGGNAARSKIGVYTTVPDVTKDTDCNDAKVLIWKDATTTITSRLPVCWKQCRSDFAPTVCSVSRKSSQILQRLQCLLCCKINVHMRMAPKWPLRRLRRAAPDFGLREYCPLGQISWTWLPLYRYIGKSTWKLRELIAQWLEANNLVHPFDKKNCTSISWLNKLGNWCNYAFSKSFSAQCYQI